MKTTDENHIRTIRLIPYRRGCGPRFTLQLWDTYKRIDGKNQLAYRLSMHDAKTSVLFTGADFGCSPMDAIDSDATIESLMGFLTLRPGDTDPEYFQDYSAAQLEYADQHAEALSCEVSYRSPTPQGGDA